MRYLYLIEFSSCRSLSVTVLGASGDLAKKKARLSFLSFPIVISIKLHQSLQTFPALFGLFSMGFLPKDVKIVGYARTKMDDTEFHKRITSYIKTDEEDALHQFKEFTTYVSGGYEDAESFEKLNAYLEEIESHYQTKECNRIFYLALPPSVFIAVARNIKEHVYIKENGVNRIIIEKPFGKDLASARQLLSSVKQHWTEDETYRIDHYLGKEMVKNILVLRFANIALGAAWDKNSISNVQITFKEAIGTEGRGGYFDEFGIIRDILQNRELVIPHLLGPWRSCWELLYRFAASPEYFDYGETRFVLS